YLVGPAPDLSAKVGLPDHPVHEAPALGRLGVVAAAQEPDLARPLLSHDPREVGRPEPGVERANPRSRLPEDRIVRGDRQIAQDVQDVPAANRVAIHRRDHGFRHFAYQAMQVLDLEKPRLGGAVVTRLRSLLLIPAT